MFVDIDAGYELLKQCPRTNANNAQTRWIMYQLNDPDSKIYHWSKADIKAGLAAIGRTTGLSSMASSSTGRAAPPPPVKKEKWEVKPSSSGPIDLTDEQHSPPKTCVRRLLRRG